MSCRSTHSKRRTPDEFSVALRHSSVDSERAILALGLFALDGVCEPSLLSSLQLGGTRRHQAKIRRSEAIPSLPGGRLAMTYTIFEGTSEIQRLVIARSISGVHIP